MARLMPVAALSVLVGCTPQPDGSWVCPAANVKLTAIKDAACTDALEDPAVDQAIQTLRSENDIPGCAVAIVEDNEILSLNFDGVAEIDGDREWDVGTPAPVGSIAKTLTALAVLRLFEGPDGEPPGPADLDAPISDYLVLLLQWDDLTLRQLLSHTTGIRKDPNQTEEPLSDADLQDWFPDGGDHPGIHPRYAYFTYWKSDDEPSFASGDTARYSNIGYALAGTVVDYLSYGEPYHPPPGNDSGYERFVFEEVGLDGNKLTEPTMLSLCLGTPWREASIYKRAQGYATDGVTAITTPSYSGWEGPPGGWTMTIGDLARLMIIINTHRVISEETTSGEMLADYGASGASPATDGKNRWGLGVYRDLILNRFAFGKGGDYIGFTSHFIMWRNEGVGVGLICNRDEVPHEEMAEAIKTIAATRLPVTGPGPPPPPADKSTRMDKLARLSRERPEQVAELIAALAELPGGRGRGPAAEAMLGSGYGRELRRLFEAGDLEAMAGLVLDRIEAAPSAPPVPIWTDSFE